MTEEVDLTSEERDLLDPYVVAMQERTQALMRKAETGEAPTPGEIASASIASGMALGAAGMLLQLHGKQPPAGHTVEIEPGPVGSYKLRVVARQD